MKKTVTNPVTLGQLKRIGAILVDTIPQEDLTKIMGDALTNGALNTEIESFWRWIIGKFSPLYFHISKGILPSCDLAAVQKFISNTADFKEEEFCFPPNYIPTHSEMCIVPFKHQSCIRDISTDIREAGFQPATPEDLLGLIIAAHELFPTRCNRRIMAIGRIFPDNNSGCIIVLEVYSEGKLRLLRERISEKLFDGEYNILAIEKPRHY